MKLKFKTIIKHRLADTLTPVNIYFKLRDHFAGTILLESSDYHGQENSLSIICCTPLASFCVKNEEIITSYPGGARERNAIEKHDDVLNKLEAFRNSFVIQDADSRYVHNGIFGYTSYDAVRYFDSVSIQKRERTIPDIFYAFYQFVIIINHFSNEMVIINHVAEKADGMNDLLQLEHIIVSNRFSSYSFKRNSEEISNLRDEDFLTMVAQAKQHCFRGDVFQLVVSRRFQCSFQGDEFNVYRALRSINPSPYLFYFDYGYFKLMGSSPEAQLQIKQRKALIYPIAGTFRRTGNDQHDAMLASQLAEDKKENAEHIMLVDLARNDMSRSARDVKVEVFKEIQFYSHVIHLVSKVSGLLEEKISPVRMAADTFPAGTLSGAPKHMALNLIDRYENINRGFYGGAIGYLGFDDTYNHAIMIRTFLSYENKLTFQAGAGIVSQSVPELELEEVNNKLAALRKAVVMAESI